MLVAGNLPRRPGVSAAASAPQRQRRAIREGLSKL